MDEIDYENCFSELILSAEDMEGLHKTLFEMLKDIHFVCEKYNIYYSLSGGTCLGAVRHKGFIPWDDDVDILIMGQEKYKFFECIKKEFGNKYEVQDFSYNNAYTVVSKIVLNNTKNVEVLKENWPINKGIFIDVFAWENVSRNKMVQKTKAFIYKFCLAMFFKKMYYKFPPKYVQSKYKEYPQLKRRYEKRKWLTRLLFFLSPRYFQKKLVSLGEKNRKTGMVCVPNSSYGYNSEIFSVDEIIETIDVEFEKFNFKILKNYDKYLKNLYGDYMIIPPENRRHRHIALELKIGD